MTTMCTYCRLVSAVDEQFCRLVGSVLLNSLRSTSYVGK